MSFFSSASTSNEHKMIDVQYDIDKLQADLEFHQQKIRLITVELKKKQVFCGEQLGILRGWCSIH